MHTHAALIRLGYNVCTVIPVAGHRTHGTTFRALKVTSQVATPGAESAVNDCLVSFALSVAIREVLHKRLKSLASGE